MNTISGCDLSPCKSDEICVDAPGTNSGYTCQRMYQLLDIIILNQYEYLC